MNRDVCAHMNLIDEPCAECLADYFNQQEAKRTEREQAMEQLPRCPPSTYISPTTPQTSGDCMRNKQPTHVTERKRKTNQKWAAANKHKCESNNRRYSQTMKARFLKVYGGACALCKESDPVVLTLDHVQGDGAYQRRLRGNAAHTHWRIAAQNYAPDRYRILCFNCQHREKVRMGLNRYSKVVTKTEDQEDPLGPLFEESA